MKFPIAIQLYSVRDDMEKDYDGMPFDINDYYHIEGTLLDPTHQVMIQGFSLEANADVLTGTYTVEWMIVDEFGIEVTEYNLETKLGQYSITPRKVYINTPSAEKVYDGFNLENQEWSYVDENNTNLIEGDELFIILTNKDSNVGMIFNDVSSYVIYDSLGNLRNNDNYHIIINVFAFILNF